MAGESKQIYQLTSGTFNGSSLVPFEVPNTDSSTSAERPYITRKTTGDEVSEFVAKTQEFETDLETDSKTIIGAINELKIQSKSVSGTTSASGAIGLGLPSGAKVLNVVVTSATNQFAFFRHDGYAHIYQMSESSSTLGNLVRMANISVTVEVYYFV